MNFTELFKQKSRIISFEIYPPKKQEQLNSLPVMLEQLKQLHPDFISVTQGAGGNAIGVSSLKIAASIKSDFGIESLAHVTCINSDKQDLSNMLKEMSDYKIDHILALRGDRNPDLPPKKDFLYSDDLVRFIKQNGNFHISGACYPQGHPESISREEELAHLKVKVEAGVQHLITQLLLENEYLYVFLEQLERVGISVPISVGIMPVVNKAQVGRIVSLCGIKMPQPLINIMERYDNSPEDMAKAGVEYAVHQISDLYKHGIDAVHLYILNNPLIAKQVCEGVRSLTS